MKRIEKLAEGYALSHYQSTRYTTWHKVVQLVYQDGIRKGIGLIAELVYHNSLIDDCVVDDAAIAKLLKELEAQCEVLEQGELDGTNDEGFD